MGYLPPWVLRWVVGALVTLVVWLAWASTRTPEALWAPGNLSRYHAGIKQCTSCHEPFHGPTAARCVTCHGAGTFPDPPSERIATFHVAAIRTKAPCLTCHTEHRGDSAPITTRSLDNPHGDFVFLATQAATCLDCHAYREGFGKPPEVLDNELVRDLIEDGGGAHRRGGFAGCLSCHVGDRIDLDYERTDTPTGTSRKARFRLFGVRS